MVRYPVFHWLSMPMQSTESSVKNLFQSLLKLLDFQFSSTEPPERAPDVWWQKVLMKKELT